MSDSRKMYNEIQLVWKRILNYLITLFCITRDCGKVMLLVEQPHLIPTTAQRLICNSEPNHVSLGYRILLLLLTLISVRHAIYLSIHLLTGVRNVTCSLTDNVSSRECRPFLLVVYQSLSLVLIGRIGNLGLCPQSVWCRGLWEVPGSLWGQLQNLF